MEPFLSDGASWRRLFDALPVAVLLVDLAQTPLKIVDANPRAYAVLGYPARTLAGMAAAALLSAEAFATVCTLARGMGVGQSATVEILCHQSDASLLPVRLKVAIDSAEVGHLIVIVEETDAALGRRAATAAGHADHRSAHRTAGKAPANTEPLTAGEFAVLLLVAKGAENQEIAQLLHLSVYTVANRLRIIYDKLHVNNRTQAALYALRQGWADLDAQGLPP